MIGMLQVGILNTIVVFVKGHLSIKTNKVRRSNYRKKNPSSSSREEERPNKQINKDNV